MSNQPIFRGAATAIVTPMREGTVDYEAYGKLIDWQLAQGINAIVAAGTTGEASTLTDEEHREVIRYTVERVGGKVPVIAGTGSNDTAYAIDLTRYACEVGADAMLLVTPYYNKATQKGLITSFTAIADASDKPIILYNVPSRTGFHLTMEHYRALAKHPNIVGVKEASADLELIETLCAECGDELDVYTGNDSQTVAAMRLGACGVISVYSNLFPDVMLDLYRHCARGNYRSAEALRHTHLARMSAIFTEINPIPVKFLLSERGLCCPEYRLPLCPPSPHTQELLHKLF